MAWLLLILLCAAAGVFYYDPLWVHDQQVQYRLWRAGVHGRSIIAGRYRIHYLEAAPPDGTPGIPLLLIHGLGDRAELAPQIPALAAAGFHVYAPDLLGYGRSDWPDIAFTIPVEVSAVVDFMGAVGLREADVAGWSMGGWIAAELTLAHPQLVDRLILEDAAGMRFDPVFPRDLFTPRDEAGLTRLLSMLSPHRPAMPHFVARAALRKLARGSRAVESSMDAMESGQYLLDRRLTAVKQPTLIVWGSEDRLLPMATAEEMHREIGQSVMATIRGCGHLAPAECAAPVLQTTIRFLKADPPMPRGEVSLDGNPAATIGKVSEQKQ